MQIKTNIQHLENYKKYLQVIYATKEYLNKKKYLEIDLPVLSPALVPESYLEIFATEFIYCEQRENLYLTPSPELFLKRILAYGGMDCYYLGKSFRNSESFSDRHSFEFTMLEFYKTKADYFDIADELLKLMRYIALKLNKSDNIIFHGKKVSFKKWEKLKVAEAFSKYAGISEDALFNHKKFLKEAKAKGYVIDGFTFEDVFSQIYAQEVEPKLGINGYPTLLYDYPKEFAALAKLNPDKKTAQRFEFYIHGVELGDCYTELTDWKEQDGRFKNEDLSRRKSKSVDHPIDKGFIDALKHGLVDCAGIAVGFDRFAMIFANATSIHELKLIDIC